MPGQLGFFERTIADSSGTVKSSATVEIRRQGATVASGTGTSPLTVTVNDRGAIEAGDTVKVYRSGTTQVSSGGGESSFNVDSRTATTVVLSGFSGTLTLADEDRITPLNSLPTLYNDSQSGETKSNPLTSSSTGYVSAWLLGGFYDRLVSHADLTATLFTDDYISPLGNIFDVTQAPYFLRFDNSTDITATLRLALRDALTSAGGNSGGAVVQLPAGIGILSGVVNVGEVSGVSNTGRVWIRGLGKRTTVLKAHSSFSFNGSTDSMLRIGAGLGGNMHDVRLSDLSLDCNNVANSIGIYSTQCQEGSGPENLLVENFKVKGIFYDTSGCQNWAMRSVETFHTSTTAIGIDISSNSSCNTILDVTCNSSNATQSSNPGIRITSSQVDTIRVHVETHDVGINYASGSSGACIGPSGHSSVVSVVKVDQPGVQILSMNQNSATNAVNDTVTGAGTYSLASGGFTLIGNDGSGAGNKAYITSSDTEETRFPGPLRGKSTLDVEGTFTAAAAVDLGSMTDIASAPTITLTAGTFFRLTGSTGVDTINTGTDSRVIFLTGPATGSVSVSQSGNVRFQQAGAVTFDVDTLAILIYNPTAAKWLGVVAS